MTHSSMNPSIKDYTEEDLIVVKAIGEFHGGVYPAENKEQSMRLPVGELPIPKELVFPVSQHMGAPAEPIVEVGEQVLAGQKIAEAIGVFSASIHASSSGIVSAIEDRVLPHPSGMSGTCIVIETDGKHDTIEYPVCEDFTQHTAAELLDKIKHAGITGLGGAGFPTALKLNPQAQYNIDTLILNGTECEPYITADHSLMLHHAEEVIKGAELLSFILGQPKQVLIAVEDNKPDAIVALEAAIKQSSSQLSSTQHIRIVTFPTKYPSGGEKQLIQLLTGTEVPSGAIPASLGIVMQNVGTAVAAYHAIALGQPLTTRITTFVGESLKTQRNLKVLLGTPIEWALEQLEYQTKNNDRLIMGGPMMGFALSSTSTPIIKSTNCVIAPSKKELPKQSIEQACIRCGMCAEACPASLLPQQLYWYAKAEDHERAQNHNLFDCIECGACSFVCPSNIPLVQYYRSAKGAIRQQDQEKTKSDHARQRFEFRKMRIEKAEAEKAAKREARKKAAEEAKKRQAEKKASDPSKAKEAVANDPVAAAMARVKQQQNDPATQKAKMERAVSSAQSRLEKLQTKLKKVDDDHKSSIAAQIKQAEMRLQDAEKQLADLPTTAKTESTASTESATPPARVPSTAQLLDRTDNESTPQLDAASSAIAKAKAKASAAADMSPLEKLQQQQQSLEQRLDKAKNNLSKAEQENSEHLDAFKNAADKLEQKLAATLLLVNAEAAKTIPAEKPNVELETKVTVKSEQPKEGLEKGKKETQPQLDAASSAIEKAKAKAAAAASLSPLEKLQQQLQSLEQRLEKSRQKLSKAEEDNSEHIDAFRNAVDKLEQKLAATQDELAQATASESP